MLTIEECPKKRGDQLQESPLISDCSTVIHCMNSFFIAAVANRAATVAAIYTSQSAPYAPQCRAIIVVLVARREHFTRLPLSGFNSRYPS